MPDATEGGAPPLTITAKEIASLLGMSVHAFHRLRRTPQFTPEPVLGGGYGSRLMWSRAEVMEWFRSRGMDPEAERQAS